MADRSSRWRRFLDRNKVVDAAVEEAKAEASGALDSVLDKAVARAMPRLRRFEPAAVRVGKQAVPAVKLARLDATVLRAWLKSVGPVREELGQYEGAQYTELVLAAAEAHAPTARVVAFSLPDHLARVPKESRPRYLRILRIVARERSEALPLVIRTLPELMGKMDDEGLAHYVARGMELFGDSPRKAESFLRVESGEGIRTASELKKGTQLLDVRRTLTLYARAHCGADVQVRPGERGAFTDGRHIYLPPQVDTFGDERDYLVYRVLTARSAGYLEFGTLDLDLDELEGKWAMRQEGELELERLFRSYPNRSLAKDIFKILENVRVESRVREEYPGIARDMDALSDQWRPERPEPEGMAPAELAIELLARVALGMEAPALPGAGDAAEDARRARAAADAAAAVLAEVQAAEATVLDTISALHRAYEPVDALLRRVNEDDLQRLDDQDPMGGRGGGYEDDEPGQSPTAPDPSQQGQGQDRQGRNPNADPTEGDEDYADYRPMEEDPWGAELRPEAMSDKERDVESRARELLQAMRESEGEGDLADARRRAREEQSYEEMAAFLDRLEAPSGPMREQPRERSIAEELTGSRGGGGALDAHTEGARKVFLYPEWDASIDDHKPSWVRLTEYMLEPGSADFVHAVREEHGPLIGRIRRSFEALRPEANQRIRGLPDGDEIDLDRAIAARIERRAGGSPSNRIYMKHQRAERDVAVAFLVDMSSSTNELANAEGKRIIDVEKQALVLIAEALDAIGDRYAIYGFSGYGRDQVAFYVAKDFDDASNDAMRERVGRMSWKMENRDGAAIRHATVKLSAVQARVKLLLLLSDGKPLDCGCDHYSDRYAQEDTRQALTEARKLGIHPFCITVDPLGQDYLKHMYGEAGYTVIDRVDALPSRLPLIYRRLTR